MVKIYIYYRYAPLIIKSTDVKLIKIHIKSTKIHNYTLTK
jgi:hypothetical protein